MRVPRRHGSREVHGYLEVEGRSNMSGFFDEYQDDTPNGGGSFLTGKEKELLIDEGVVFPIVSVTSATTKFGPRWIVGIELEGESRAVGFSKGKVFSRDRMLTAMQAHLDNGGDPIETKIALNGRSQVLVNPNEG